MGRFWKFYAENGKVLRLVQTERVVRRRIGQFKARVKCAQIENSLSYCINACDLRWSEQGIRHFFDHEKFLNVSGNFRTIL